MGRTAAWTGVLIGLGVLLVSLHASQKTSELVQATDARKSSDWQSLVDEASEGEAHTHKLGMIPPPGQRVGSQVRGFRTRT